MAGEDLFSGAAEERLAARAPLAARLRPRTLDEIVGQPTWSVRGPRCGRSSSPTG